MILNYTRAYPKYVGRNLFLCSLNTVCLPGSNRWAFLMQCSQCRLLSRATAAAHKTIAVNCKQQMCVTGSTGAGFCTQRVSSPQVKWLCCQNNRRWLCGGIHESGRHISPRNGDVNIMVFHQNIRCSLLARSTFILTLVSNGNLVYMRLKLVIVVRVSSA